MELKDIKLKKGMSRDEVNELISEWIELEDKYYTGTEYVYNWKCRCGNIIKCRRWSDIKGKGRTKCKKCTRDDIRQKHKVLVEKRGDYMYLNSYFKGETASNGNVVNKIHLKIRHKYCGKEFIKRYDQFINEGCSECCKEYKNSFAYHIEKELNLRLEDVWDFEKNTVNPYHIWKCSGNKKIGKVWIKCQEKDHHGSYSVNVSNYYNGTRCCYCAKNTRFSKKEDSFAQYHIDNTGDDFLYKFWDWEKNVLNPFEISPGCKDEIWIKCQEKDHHGSYKTSCSKFTSGIRCGYCAGNSNKVHPFDSFGYHNFDKVMSWHPDNDISPFKVKLFSHNEYKFICYKCGDNFKRVLNNMSLRDACCANCSSSKGERKVGKWLKLNNIEYVQEKEFENLLSNSSKPLRYDFYLPIYNTIIEYDGLQHDKWIKSWVSEYEFNKLRHHDKLKDEYAENNNIKLIRIKEKDFNNIEEILTKELQL